MELEAFLIHEQLIVVAHNILLGLVNIHRLQVHIGNVLLASSTLQEIVLVLGVVGARELLVESLFESVALGQLIEFLELVMEI